MGTTKYSVSVSKSVTNFIMHEEYLDAVVNNGVLGTGDIAQW
jgi:hypothetical protein